MTFGSIEYHSAVHGYYVFKSVWEPKESKVLSCSHEVKSIYNMFVKKTCIVAHHCQLKKYIYIYIYLQKKTNIKSKTKTKKMVYKKVAHYCQNDILNPVSNEAFFDPSQV